MYDLARFRLLKIKIIIVPSASQQSTASLPQREEIKIEQEFVKKSSDFQQNTGLSVATPSSSNAHSNNQHFLKISVCHFI
jgi:hypothetical protein